MTALPLPCRPWSAAPGKRPSGETQRGFREGHGGEGRDKRTRLAQLSHGGSRGDGRVLQRGDTPDGGAERHRCCSLLCSCGTATRRAAAHVCRAHQRRRWRPAHVSRHRHAFCGGSSFSPVRRGCQIRPPAPSRRCFQPTMASGVEVQQLGAVAICGSGGHGACTRVCLSKAGAIVSGTADGTLQVRAPGLHVTCHAPPSVPPGVPVRVGVEKGGGGEGNHPERRRERTLHSSTGERAACTQCHPPH